MASVARLEQRSFNAWPAVRTAVMDGWLLRSSGGYTKRANSANAVQAGALLDGGLLQAIEAWYARQQLPAIFRLSPLADGQCDALLAARGYALVEPSRFLLRYGTPADCQLPAVHVEPRCTPAWLTGYAQASGLAGSAPMPRWSKAGAAWPGAWRCWSVALRACTTWWWRRNAGGRAWAGNW